ncbi:MAG TPA: hypothetical protein VHS05_14405 [Pyrinomonadaceae bacterium]|jgi:hypothetical protein|nr:hypothetical protein [Pyrinomonadaceae bacterium]
MKNDLIGIAIIIFVVLCGLFGLSRLSKPYDVSVEEFEKRAREGPSLISAGLSGLNKFLDPAAEKAAEVQEDLRQGRYDKKEESGDPPEAGIDNDDKVTNGESDA